MCLSSYLCIFQSLSGTEDTGGGAMAELHQLMVNFTYYSKCSNFSNTFLFLFSNKMLVIRAGIHKIIFRIAKLGMLLQKQSDLVLHCLSRPICYTMFQILEHLPYICIPVT